MSDVNEPLYLPLQPCHGGKDVLRAFLTLVHFDGMVLVYYEVMSV